jgi:hypothetical protein
VVERRDDVARVQSMAAGGLRDRVGRDHLGVGYAIWYTALTGVEGHRRGDGAAERAA